MKSETETEANSHRYTAKANLLYVDYKDLGFSYSEGDDVEDLPVEEYLLRFLSRFIEAFPQYEHHDVGIMAWDRGAHDAVRLAEKLLLEVNPLGNHWRLDSLYLISPHLAPKQEIGSAIQYGQVNPYTLHKQDEDHLEELHDQWWDQFLGACLNLTSRRDEWLCPDVVTGYEHLYDTVTAGRDLPDQLFPNIDPFNVLVGRQDRALPYVYHRQSRTDGLADWLNSDDTRELLGLEDFAEAGHKYKSFDSGVLQDLRKKQLRKQKENPSPQVNSGPGRWLTLLFLLLIVYSHQGMHGPVREYPEPRPTNHDLSRRRR